MSHRARASIGADTARPYSFLSAFTPLARAHVAFISHAQRRLHLHPSLEMIHAPTGNAILLRRPRLSQSLGIEREKQDRSARTKKTQPSPVPHAHPRSKSKVMAPHRTAPHRNGRTPSKETKVPPAGRDSANAKSRKGSSRKIPAHQRQKRPEYRRERSYAHSDARGENPDSSERTTPNSPTLTKLKPRGKRKREPQK
ncbi:hypothetical protein C8R44DRAFT_363748 [Mycena epipterygia]|nr:hypothetical protein C8R44DRAFT_363748 [Mycena epipterygia]